jgi:hypothetical protein
MHRFQRTMRRFRYDVLSKRSRDSMKGREGKANVAHPFAAGHLLGTINLDNQR